MILLAAIPFPSLSHRTRPRRKLTTSTPTLHPMNNYLHLSPKLGRLHHLRRQIRPLLLHLLPRQDVQAVSIIDLPGMSRRGD